MKIQFIKQCLSLLTCVGAACQVANAAACPKAAMAGITATTTVTSRDLNGKHRMVGWGFRANVAKGDKARARVDLVEFLGAPPRGCSHKKGKAGLIRRECKGVELKNSTRCAELKKKFRPMVVGLLRAYENEAKESAPAAAATAFSWLLGRPVTGRPIARSE
jgi:hypothetical protein